MTRPRFANWIPEEEAARRLGISTRTLRRKPDHQPPARAFRPRRGKKPEPVYSPEDVAMLEAQRNPSVVIPPDTDNPANNLDNSDTGQISQISQSRTTIVEALQGAFDHLASVLASVVTPGTLVLTRKQAALETGFTQAYIRRAIADGRLRTFRDGPFIKVRRTDLALLARQATEAPQQKENECQQRKAPSLAPPRRPPPKLSASSQETQEDEKNQQPIKPTTADVSECPAELTTRPGGSVIH